MKVHEYQAKGLFADYGVPVDKSILCKTPEEAVAAYKKLGVQRCVVKAQVHTGGRGKAGGVKLATNETEVRQYANAILGMDIKGFGAAAVIALTHAGCLHDIADIYTLHEHRDELISSGIIGREKTVDKLLDAIAHSKENPPDRLLTGFGIAGIGRAAAISLMQAFPSIDALAEAARGDAEKILAVPDMGEVSARSLAAFFDSEAGRGLLEKFRAAGVNFASAPRERAGTALEGKSFVITGTLPTLSREGCAALIAVLAAAFLDNGEAVADFHALDGVDAHQGFGDVGV